MGPGFLVEKNVRYEEWQANSWCFLMKTIEVGSTPYFMTKFMLVDQTEIFIGGITNSVF